MSLFSSFWRLLPTFSPSLSPSLSFLWWGLVVLCWLQFLLIATICVVCHFFVDASVIVDKVVVVVIVLSFQYLPPFLPHLLRLDFTRLLSHWRLERWLAHRLILHSRKLIFSHFFFLHLLFHLFWFCLLFDAHSLVFQLDYPFDDGIQLLDNIGIKTRNFLSGFQKFL